ncbi:hypothetical protein [uncultured Subdoligranulum sp.]|uniref:hypothetical protein n=1 Tax=uncultured Subdoligranulum sp. TaxID=512298 RepID=UPI0025D90485|nr:hypothetical protein [uncultured Subdoligranulum sp.]
MTQRKTKALWAVLAVLCGLVMLRTAFTGLEIDEEYALSLGYRLVSGDRLFATMWEPHQLSALPAAALLAVYLGVTGTTTGVLLFFRLVVLACKAAMSWVFYREFRRDLGRGGAALAALVLFLYIPKWFLGPDYTGQQFHFTVATFLCLHHYVTRGFRRPWLVVLGAVCACFGFLAFPQSIAAFPFLWVGVVVLGRRGGEKRFFGIPRGAWLLLGSCAVCGGAFLIWALQGMGFDLGAFLERVGLILHDPQYSFTAAERLALLAQQALPVVRSLLWPLLGAAVLCAVVRWRRGALPGGVSLLLGSWGALAALQCTARAVLDGSLDERQFVPVLVLAGAWVFWRARRQPGAAELFWLGYLPGLAAYAFILRSTLLGLPATFMYLTWPALCGLVLLVRAEVRPVRLTGYAALGAMLVFLAVCRLWCVETTGWKSANVADTPLVQIETGPAKGIWADEKAADMQECLYEALEPCAGQQLLQAIGEQHGLGFLMADGTLTVGQASVISGTDSDPRFVQYYEEMPEKLPDVILYDDAEVRDMTEFHAWIEENLAITDRYTVTHGTASLQVLVVDGRAR